MVLALICAIVFFVFMKHAETRKPFKEVKAQLKTSVTSIKMQPSTSRFLKKYYGLNADDYTGVWLCAPVTNMDAEELLLIKCKSEGQIEATKDAILQRQLTKQTTFEGYAPEQFELCQNYILDERGTFLLFIVAPDAEEIDAVFRNSF